MPSPMPRAALANERLSPSPNESRSTIESVPQAIASDRQDDPLALVRRGRRGRGGDEGELGDRESHESFSATTGSSSDARRAGK